jgi:signal peptidase I
VAAGEPSEIPQPSAADPALAPASEIAPAAPKPSKPNASFREYLESLLVTVVLALFGTTFVVQAFKIPSPSMEPTLLIGDHLLVNKFVYGGTGAWYERVLPYREIRRGDIIVFKFPFDDHPHYVKRVIGVPGDRVRIVEQQVYINGQPLDEPYKVHSGPEDSFGANFPLGRQHYPPHNLRPEWAAAMGQLLRDGQLHVPAGKYFVMGDNRDSSLDSRYWGLVDRESIMGRPLLIYWSFEPAPPEFDDSTAAGRVKGWMYAILRLPASTRWARMFRPVG